MNKESTMKHFIFSILLVMLISISSASILNVPGEYPNIRSAIINAQDGDSISVSAGTYQGYDNTNLNFYGKAIYLYSESGWENTKIDCQDYDDRRGFEIISGEDQNTVIEGFNIYNCKSSQYGGNIYIYNSSPVFKNCRVESGYSRYRGDGVAIMGTSDPLFDNVIFYSNGGNWENNSGYNRGGAAYIENDADATFNNCEFWYNGQSNYYHGGAVYLENTSNTIEFNNCYFYENGRYSGEGTDGGALYAYNSRLSLNNCEFEYNGTDDRGGAIYLTSATHCTIDGSYFHKNGRGTYYGGAIFNESSDSLIIKNTRLVGNGWKWDYYSNGYDYWATYNDMNHGGAIYTSGSYTRIENCEITRNRTYASSDRGMGIFIGGCAEVDIISSTITRNYWSSGGSWNDNDQITIDNECNSLTLINSIGEYEKDDNNWDNVTEIDHYFDSSDGNIEFVNPDRSDRRLSDFRLSVHSHAIGMGNSENATSDFDLNGNSRVNPVGSNVMDAGCYENTREFTAPDDTQLYVSPGGDDELGDGQIDNPFKTVYLANVNSNRGDDLLLEPGTYNEPTTINLCNREVDIIGLQGSDETFVNSGGLCAFKQNGCSYNSTLTGMNIYTSSDTSIFTQSRRLDLEDIVTSSDIEINYTSNNLLDVISYGEIYMLLDGSNYVINLENVHSEPSNSDDHALEIYNSGNDIDININNSSFIRPGSPGSSSNDAIRHDGGGSSDDTRTDFNITNTMLHGDVELYNIREFNASNTIFEDSYINFRRYHGSYSDRADIDIKFTNFINSEMRTDGMGYVQNSIIYPTMPYTLEGSGSGDDASTLQFIYCLNAPEEDLPSPSAYNISGDPLFVDFADGDYSLLPASPCINSGNIDTDMDGIIWSEDSDDLDPDGSRHDMGTFFFDQNGFYQAVITSVDDVPDDQGGLVRISWDASPNDVENGNITWYQIWRVNEDGDDGLDMVVAVQDLSYSYVATTVNDSVPDNPNAETFVITAHTPDLEIYYSSDPASGYSIDNIAPSIPQTFSMSNNNNIVMLSWDENTEEDFDYYSVYRNGEKVVDLAVTYFEELNFGALSYYVTATDYHGNESEPTELLNIQLNLPGDVNLDDVVNVFDVVLMVEYILTPQESDFTDLEFGLADVNYDGELNILDIMHWINVILGLGREDINMAQSAKLFIQNDKLTHKADGLVGYHITLAHEPGLEITLTDAAMLTDFVTHDNVTEVIILNPESEILFTTNGEFEILEVMTANAENIIATDIIQVPDEFRLKSIYPNPFNPVTNISVDLPEETMLSVMVYDLNGRLVATLVDKRLMDPGNQMIAWTAGNHASGVYLISVSALESSFTQRITLLK